MANVWRRYVRTLIHARREEYCCLVCSSLLYFQELNAAHTRPELHKLEEPSD